jgi:flagellar hook-associated protein 1 FlgK
MTGIYGLILNSGRNAMLTQQKAIDVTGHNIANANTPGYSRQRVDMQPTAPIGLKPGLVGTGVQAAEIKRVHDRFVSYQINNEKQGWGQWEAQKNALERVELIFDESLGYGLNQVMSDFWNAWQDLNNNPSGHSERTALTAKSQTLASTFNQMNDDLSRIQTDLNTSIQGTLYEINPLLEQLAALNVKIADLELGAQHANDYMDQRDLLLGKLSEMIDINTFEDERGMVNIMTKGGKPLVEKAEAWQLDSAPDPTTGMAQVFWVDTDQSTLNITSDIQGGKLKGWIEVRDTHIPEYRAELDNLAQGIMGAVNGAHQSGYDLDGTLGEAFFLGTSAGDMTLNTDIQQDTRRIAASGSAAGVPGNGDNALTIARLQTNLTMSGGAATFDDYYRSMVSDVGVDVQRTLNSHDYQTSMVTLVENYRESISGVSLDEEMINLIKFQHAFDAAAKLINVADEMLNTVVQMV